MLQKLRWLVFQRILHKSIRHVSPKSCVKSFWRRRFSYLHDHSSCRLEFRMPLASANGILHFFTSYIAGQRKWWHKAETTCCTFGYPNIIEWTYFQHCEDALWCGFRIEIAQIRVTHMNYISFLKCLIAVKKFDLAKKRLILILEINMSSKESF